MPPKIKVTKDQIIKCACELVRENGDSAINARIIAARLGCSTQPVFSNFSSMDELRSSVVGEAERLYNEYIENALSSDIFPKYKSAGMGYIEFARNERELFKLLFMRDRKNEVIPKTTEELESMAALVKANTSLSLDDARLFHIEMWVFVHGIASMIATRYLELDSDTVSNMLTDIYCGLTERFKEKKNGSN